MMTIGMEINKLIIIGIMRQSNYILALLFSFMFFSCEKDELVRNENKTLGEGEEFYINMEDTTGIIVPEGYSLVIFPGNQAMTRATEETRITHLQYIIYQKDDSNNWIQYQSSRKINQDYSSWPLKAIAISLPQNKDYRVVFLGNVDKSVFGSNQTTDVLSGTGVGTNYSDARIILPRVEFTDRNMYYHTKADFQTTVGTTPVINVTLKRIVSRNDITKAGLQTKYAAGVIDNMTYKKAYWEQIIKEKMKECIFTGKNSSFKNQVAEDMKKGLIYPLIYIGLVEQADAKTLIAQGDYPATTKYIEEWEAYKPEKVYLDAFDKYKKEYLGTHITKEYANNVFIRYAEYLYGIFCIDKDEATLSKALGVIYENNIQIEEKDENGVTSNPCSITAAIEKVIAAFNAQYTSGVLLPWRLMPNNSYSVIEINTQMPKTVTFDLEPIAEDYEAIGSKYYKIKDADDNTSDKYISIVTLGENDNNASLQISSITSASAGGLTIDHTPTTTYIRFVNKAFTAGSFQRNIKSTTTQEIQNIVLIDNGLVLNENNYKQKIEVSIYNVLQVFNPQGTDDLTVGNGSYTFSISKIGISANFLSSIQTSILNMLTGKYTPSQLSAYDKLSFPFVTFISPNVSPENLNVTTEWTIK